MALFDDARLSTAAGAFISEAATTRPKIAISTISLAEVVYLIEKNRLPPSAYDELTQALADPEHVFTEAVFTADIVQVMRQVVSLIGDIESSGNKLEAPAGFVGLFESFLRWEPVPPKSAKELAQSTARLCRLLRDEVTEQLSLKSAALTELATDWRKLLFPDATDERFADGYAQAVTFGLLMARAKNIELADGLQQVATTLSQSRCVAII